MDATWCIRGVEEHKSSKFQSRNKAQRLPHRPKKAETNPYTETTLTKAEATPQKHQLHNHKRIPLAQKHRSTG